MRVAVLAIAVALSTGLTATAARAQIPNPAPSASLSPEDILARWKAADDVGTRSEAEHESWTMHVAGLDGTFETLRRGDSTETETTLGPFKTARGTARGQKWHQNENGETILDRIEPSQAEHMVAQTSARVREPVDAWVINTTFASGHVTHVYYDPKTFYVIRSERTVAGRTSHMTFEDFRTDARGRTRYWHLFGGDDRPENDVDYRLIRDDITADVTESDVALPHDRRTLVEFPAGTDTVRLPARIENDRIYVRVDIGGRGLDFLLDTGASFITLNADVARELKLPEYGHTVQTVGGSFSAARVVAPEMKVGNLSLHDVVIHTVPLASDESHDTRVVGLLGFDFLDDVGLRIDYAGGTVDAMRPAVLVAPAGVSPLDIRLNLSVPVAHAALGEAGGDDFIFDTGAEFSYVVFQRFAHAHPEAFAPPGEGKTLVANAVGGQMPYRKIPSKRIEIGPWAFDDDTGVEALSANALGFDNEDGLIGADILKLFTVYLDYSSAKMYLVPNGRAPIVDVGNPAPARTGAGDQQSHVNAAPSLGRGSRTSDAKIDHGPR